MYSTVCGQKFWACKKKSLYKFYSFDTFGIGNGLYFNCLFAPYVWFLFVHNLNTTNKN